MMKQRTRPLVVADSGPLIALAGCRQLQLLVSLFHEIHIPQAVLDETTADWTRPGAREIADFIQNFAQVHLSHDDALYAELIRYLDEGESRALSLARELNCGVLMDERLGRRAAKQHQIPVLGVLGVLLQAKREGLIDKVEPLLLLLQNNGYRISSELLEATLRLANEPNG